MRKHESHNGFSIEEKPEGGWLARAFTRFRAPKVCITITISNPNLPCGLCFSQLEEDLNNFFGGKVAQYDPQVREPDQTKSVELIIEKSQWDLKSYSTVIEEVRQCIQACNQDTNRRYWSRLQ